jgi:hypothetical protein
MLLYHQRQVVGEGGSRSNRGDQSVEGCLRSVGREPGFKESEDVSVIGKEKMLDDSRFVYIRGN